MSTTGRTLPDPPCTSCSAVCCWQNDHDFAVLLEEGEDYPDAVDYHGLWGRNGKVERVLPYVGGKCVYLKNNRCSIYENRPQGCREFNCWSYYRSRGDKHGTFVAENPEVRELLEGIENG